MNETKQESEENQTWTDGLDPLLLAAMHKSLSEFGYPVTPQYVRDEAKRLKDDAEQPKGGPSMFIAGWLHKAGLRSTRS